jgi:membrane associated rhomboid family serine protease
MITLLIIAITVGVSLLAMQRNDIKSKYMFNAYAIAHHRQWWRFFSHGLLHGDYGHLIFNMLSLYLFGRDVEAAFTALFGSAFGWLYYLVLYVSALFFSSLFSFFKHKDNSYYNALGASGAVSAIIFARILLDPISGMGLMLIPVMIPGWIFGLLYLAYSWYKSRQGNDNIGHDAHFWGAIYGFLLLIAFKPFLWSHFILKIQIFLHF